MEHYEKGEVVNVPDQVDIPGMDNNAVHMNVKHGSKIRNLMGYAIAKMKDPEIKQITWNGHGQAVMKAISCAEIMKRKVKNLHQITQIRYKRVEEYWEPKMEGLERLKVNRDVPAVTVLLSKEPLDESFPGYQPPGPFEAFWKKTLKEEPQKKSAGARGGKSSSQTADGAAHPQPPTLARKKRKKGEKERNNEQRKSQAEKHEENKNEKTVLLQREPDASPVAENSKSPEANEKSNNVNNLSESLNTEITEQVNVKIRTKTQTNEKNT